MTKKQYQLETAPIDEPIWIFPYQSMDVGDSFFIPTLRPAHLLYVIDSSAKKAGVRVKAYTITERNLLGVRVWRLG
jgi:hypothetical protein